MKTVRLVKDNIQARLRLLNNAFFRRYIWSDIIAMSQEYGIQYRDVIGNVEPLEFARYVLGNNHAPEDSPPLFEQQLGSAKEFTPEGVPDYFNSEPKVGRFLGQLVYYRKPASVVELGCFVGWASAHLALALKANNPSGRLFCVDPNPDHLAAAAANLKRLGLDQTTNFLKGFSTDRSLLSRLPDKIDVVFLDTSHEYPETFNEIQTYAPRMAAGGCIVLHDSLRWPGVRRSLMELAGQFSTFTFATEQGNGVTVLLDAKQTM